MIDFWVSSGHLLLDKDSRGRLLVTDEFLKLYLARPELVPPEDACAAENALHATLMSNPRADAGPADIAAIEDGDARENWAVMLDFRDLLLAHASLEDSYLALMRRGVGQTPPLFVSQLLHVIMRNVLDGETDPIVLRAGEMMFRPQRLTREQGGILLADEEIVDGGEKAKHHSPLTAMLGEHKARQLDVLKAETSDVYWKRSDQFDMVLDFAAKSPGRAALARVMERWLAHMLGLDAAIAPLEKVHDEAWYWFVGLDAESTRTGNMLWRGQKPPALVMERVVALYGLDFRDVPEVAGRTIYLILSMTGQKIVTMKPQNLLAGLPDEVLATVPGGADGRA
jgi:hypothetical protein